MGADLAGYVIGGLMIILFIILGIVLLTGRGANMIAGFNTMSKEEQAKYDIRALTKFMGWSMIAIALCLGLFPFGIYFEQEGFFIVGTIGMFAIVIFMVIYSNTKHRFIKEQEQEED